MSDALRLWQRLRRFPGGRRRFSRGFARRAPYFTTVSPRFTRLEPHHAELIIVQRPGLANHLGTMHAIAMCNGLEAGMGALAEATIAPELRWIPQGMEVTYTAKADGDITCHAETTPASWAAAPEVPVRVWATRGDGTVVVEGVIHLWVTPRPTSRSGR
ncbi:MAG: hotdog fold domain-containing protein [Propioniciclava sp.]